MTFEDFYQEHYAGMKTARQKLLDIAAELDLTVSDDTIKPIVYFRSRIKSPQSALEKLRRQGLPQTKEAALHSIYDGIGLRIVCAFTEDVYGIVEKLKEHPALRILKEKDYYSYPKPNGYRSYHLRVEITAGDGEAFFAEIQVRTIALDFWATLEHRLKYKKDLPHEALIRSELKRCADEIASVDLSMQTIRDILKEQI